MPFISRGVTIGFVRADEKPLARILDELRRKKFTGRVEFNVNCEGTSYSGAIELQDGEIVAAELEYPALIRGVEALQRILNRWLQNCRGYAEIIELTRDKVAIDLEENPVARVDPKQAAQVLEEALRAITMVLEARGAPHEEEVAPTAPLVVPEEEKPAPPKPEERPEEKPAAEVVAAPAPEAAPPEAKPVAEAVPSSEEIIERLDSPLFDASIVLRGTLVDSGYVEPGQVDKLLEKLRELSKSHTDKAVVAFVNDRMNEIKAKIVVHDGIIVAMLAKKDSERLVDEEALKALASFPRPLLYDIYLVGEDVDETLYKLAEKASREAKEAAKQEEKRVEAATPPAPTPPEHAKTEEHHEEKRRRRRFFIFFRR